MILLSNEQKIQTMKARLAGAERVVVLTGAGVSAESGVPTFRGKDGLWREYKATELATPEAFNRDPGLVWEFYNWRRELLAPLRPDAAHLALADMERRFPDFTLITQNIDGLHHAAGSRNVVELHGNIWRVRCTGCGRVTENRTVPLPGLPTCMSCGALLRPHVVWFGEMLEEHILNSAFNALEACRILLIIGTSGVVQPAASMGMYAQKHGAFVAEINLEPTPQTDVYQLSICGKAGEIVPQLSKES